MEISHQDLGTVFVRRDVLKWQVDAIENVARSYSYYRIAQRNNNEIESNRIHARTHVMTLCVTNFIIDWCKIFGSNNNNKTHYTRLIDTRQGHNQFENYRKSVEDHICSCCTISNDDLVSISKTMHKFRSRFAAHIDINRIPAVPSLRDKLDIAIGYVGFLNRFDADTLWDNEIMIVNVAERSGFYEEELATFAGWPVNIQP